MIILSLSAILLMGCVGKNKKNVGDANLVKVDLSESAVSDEPEKIPHIAITVLKALAEMNDNPLYLTQEAVENVSEKDETNSEEHCACVLSLDKESDESFTVVVDCFPRTKGGYAVIFTKTSGCCLCYFNHYEGFYYKDGVLTKAEDLLPVSSIDDFYSNADAFPDEAYYLLSNSEEYYWFDDEKNQLVTGFDPFICMESIRIYLPKALRGFYLKIDESFEDFTEREQRDAIDEGGYQMFPTIAYNWDGERFVRDADSKPLEEDLKYFRKFDEFVKTAKSESDLRKGDGCIDMDCDLNGDGYPDFVNNDYERQELAIYLNDGTGVYNRFGEYECLEGFWLGDITFEDGVLELDVTNGSEKYHYKVRYQDGNFYLTDYPDVTLGSFKLGQNPAALPPPKSSYMMFSGATPKLSSMLTTAALIGPGPHI